MSNTLQGTFVDTNPQPPTGSLLMYAATTAPTGWLLCDASTVSRTTYSVLFGVIGTTYGAGDGSTTFTLPDFRGRSPVGSGTGTATGATAMTLGSTPTSGAGGEQTHILTTAEMPSHTHTQDAHTHSSSSGGKFLTDAAGGSTAGGSVGAASTALTAATTATNQNTGGGGAHNILPPMAVVNFIIKT